MLGTKKTQKTKPKLNFEVLLYFDSLSMSVFSRARLSLAALSRSPGPFAGGVSVARPVGFSSALRLLGRP